MAGVNSNTGLKGGEQVSVCFPWLRRWLEVVAEGAQLENRVKMNKDRMEKIRMGKETKKMMNNRTVLIREKIMNRKKTKKKGILGGWYF